MNWKKKTALVSAVLLSLTLVMPATAFGQWWRFGGGVTGMLTSTTTTGAPTTTTGGIIFLIVQSGNDSNAELETYMRDNAVAMQHDLHMGAGETAEDLAEFFQVPEGQTDQFAQILYENREFLAPLAEPGEVNAENVDAFVHIVVHGMLQDEAMAASFQDELG